MTVDALARRDLWERVNGASAKTRIPARHLEKDYWVTQVLRRLSNSLNGRWVFKGGTSLSKAYGLIDRFSDDIDLLLVNVDAGQDTDEFIEHMANVGTAAVRDGSYRIVDAVPGFAATIRIEYPADAAKARGVDRGIRLEPGIRGGPVPTEVLPIRPLIAQVAPEIAGESPCMQPFEVTVLHPGRTLIEKLSAVHSSALELLADPDLKVRHRFARHFYDIDRLLQPGSPAFDVLDDRDVFDAIIADCSATNQQWFSTDGGFPENFADSPAFTETSLESRLRPAYQEACDDLCYDGAPVPTWDEMCATVGAARVRLHVAT